MDTKLKNFAIQALRKATFRWPAKYEAFKKVKEQIGAYSTGRPKFQYRCQGCGKLFPQKRVVADHIEPVVPVNGWKNGMEFDFNEFIERLFCSIDNFQILCGTCHDEKSQSENSERRIIKKSKKVSKK